MNKIFDKERAERLGMSLIKKHVRVTNRPELIRLAKSALKEWIRRKYVVDAMRVDGFLHPDKKWVVEVSDHVDPGGFVSMLGQLGLTTSVQSAGHRFDFRWELHK